MCQVVQFDSNTFVVEGGPSRNEICVCSNFEGQSISAKERAHKICDLLNKKSRLAESIKGITGLLTADLNCLEPWAKDIDAVLSALEDLA